MKLVLSVLAAAAAVSLAGAADQRATSGLRRALWSDAASTRKSSTGTSTNSTSSEICVPAKPRYSSVEAQLFHSLAAVVADDSWTGVGQQETEDPAYATQCGFLDFKCYVCELCEEIYQPLFDTGNEGACDVLCFEIAEKAGGGPQNRKCNAD
jgi:hypothetical protein